MTGRLAWILAGALTWAALAAPEAKAWHAGIPLGVIGPNLQEIRGWLRAGSRDEAIVALKELEPFLTGEAQENARFMLAKAQVEAGDPAALQTLSKLPVPMAHCEDRRAILTVRANVRASKALEAKKSLEQLGGQRGRSVEKDRLTLSVAELLTREGLHDEARPLLGGLRKKKGLRRAERRRLKGLELELATTDKSKRALERELYVRFPVASDGDADSPAMELTRSERFLRAQNFAVDWKYEEALKLYEHLLKDGYRRNETRWRIAVLLQSKLRRQPETVRAMLKPIVKKEKDKRHEEALYRTLRAVIKEDRYGKALELIDIYEAAYPKGAYLEATAYYRGWLPYDERRCRRGLPALRAYVKTFKRRRRHVRGFIAWCHVRHERWKSAIRAFAPLLRDDNSQHRGKALYWQAYSHVKLGAMDKARDLLESLQADYPLSYYAFLGLRLRTILEGGNPRASALPWPATDGKVADLDLGAWSWPALRGRKSVKLARIRRLSELGELQAAREAYTAIRQSVEAAVPADKRFEFIRFMGHQIEDFNRGYRATGIGQGSRRSLRPRAGASKWHAAFPRAYRPLIERLAGQMGLVPHFIYAIMRAESAYMPTAVSHAEAVGALQMIRPTALKVAEELGLSYDPITFPNPRVGFEYSVHYLRKHLDLFGGHFLLAAASYNAGPAPVAKWLRKAADKPAAFVVEEFVYNEARGYARRVAEYLLRYLALTPVESRERGEILDALFPEDFQVELPQDVGY